MGYVIYDILAGEIVEGTCYYSSVREVEEEFKKMLESDDLPDGIYTIAYEV